MKYMKNWIIIAQITMLIIAGVLFSIYGIGFTITLLNGFVNYNYLTIGVINLITIIIGYYNLK